MIYVGIDIAKLNHFAAAISSNGEILIEPSNSQTMLTASNAGLFSCCIGITLFLLPSTTVRL